MSVGAVLPIAIATFDYATLLLAMRTCHFRDVGKYLTLS
jgi:hypothetical protein